jgi:hypothetical protein
MDELVKSVTNKITRDAAYFVGGGTIIASVWLSCDSSTVTSSIPAIIQVFLAGLAYILGFLVQEIFSLCSWFSTALFIRPGPLFRLLYRWHTREEEERPALYIPIFTAYEEAGKQTLKNDEINALIERTATLKHIGTSVGPCFLISGIVLLSSSHAWLGILALVIGLFMWIDGRLKTMQQILYLERAFPALRS